MKYKRTNQKEGKSNLLPQKIKPTQTIAKKNIKKKIYKRVFLTKFTKLRLLVLKNRKSKFLQIKDIKKKQNFNLLERIKIKRQNRVKCFKNSIETIDMNKMKKSQKGYELDKSDQDKILIENNCSENLTSSIQINKNENLVITSNRDNDNENKKQMKSSNEEKFKINSYEEKLSLFQKLKTNGNKDLICEDFKKNIFVKNISYKIDEQELLDIFKEYGKILNLNFPLRNGKSRGFAFIEFEREDEAAKSIEMNGKEIKGRKLIVSMYQKMEPFKIKPIDPKYNNSSDSKTVFINNLPFDVTREQIMGLLEKSGKINEIRIANKDGKSRGYAHVVYFEEQSANNALLIKDPKIEGRELKIELANSEFSYPHLHK